MKFNLSLLRRRAYKHLWFLRPLVYGLAVMVILLLAIWLTPPATKVFGLALNLINPAIDHLDSYQNRTNFLLLGVGGGNHPGADLTDSIMLISIDLTSGDTVLISLPRDIWVESLSAKLNTAYHYGESQQIGGGLTLTKSAVGEIVNQPIHYAAVLDFSGFEKAVDVLGGIDLVIPHGFVDEQYPIPGLEEAEPETTRYERVEFQSGRQHLNGEMALKYVRSRYSGGIEGTDYARANRQQQVILAFKNKLISPGTLLSLGKLKTLYRLFKESVQTDLPAGKAGLPAYFDLIKLGLKAKDQIRTGVIDQGSETEDLPALLYHPDSQIYGQWVLLPINDDWATVHQYVKDLFYQNK